MPIRKRISEEADMAPTDVLIINGLESFGIPKKISEEMQKRIKRYQGLGWIDKNGSMTLLGRRKHTEYYQRREAAKAS